MSTGVSGLDNGCFLAVPVRLMTLVEGENAHAQQSWESSLVSFPAP